MNKLLSIFWSKCMMLHYSLLTGNAKSYVGVTFLLLLNLSVSFAQPTLLKDINTTTIPATLQPQNIIDVNGILYFSAVDAENGRELWRTDGTPEGTYVVKDIKPGSVGSNPRNLTNVNGSLYFICNSNSTKPNYYTFTASYEIWKSDGTIAGTIKIGSTSYTRDIENPSAFPTLFFGIDNAVYYTTPGTEWNEYQLVKSDGTQAGAVILGTFSNNDENPNFTNLNGILYFAANNGLWKTNGTTAGTVLLKQFQQTYGGEHAVSNLVVANSTLFFSAFSDKGRELWKSNGTAAGTVLVKDIQTGTGSSSPYNLVAVNNTVFFAANDGINGTELWKSDGTANGTMLVKDIFTGTHGSNFPNESIPRDLTNLNGILYFTAHNSTYGRELWKSDGTTAGTVLVKDVITATTDNYDPTSLINVNGLLYFSIYKGASGVELWKSNGTAAGTVLVETIFAPNETFDSFPIASFTASNEKLYFIATTVKSSPNYSYSIQLWRSDGTASGTVPVEKGSDASSGSVPSGLVSINNITYFSATTSANGTELWKSDGTSAGTVLVKDIFPGTGSSVPRSLTNVNGMLYFTAADGAGKLQLWKSDGTATGTIKVKDFSSVAISFPNLLTNVNGTLYFVLIKADDVIELWKSNGTEAGTVVLKSFTSPLYSSSQAVYNLTNVNGVIYFTAPVTPGSYDSELWKSDGTSAGTVLVKDIRPGDTGSNPNYFTNVNGTLYFSANDGITGNELWKSDGTTAGTVLVKDIYTGSDQPGYANSSDPVSLMNVDGTLYFSALDGTAGGKIYKTNGTSAGTVVIKNIPESNAIMSLTYTNGKFYFFERGYLPNEDVFIGDLWVVDNTSSSKAIELQPGFRFFTFEEKPDLISINGIIYFNGVNDANGLRIWRSNGTVENTGKISEVRTSVAVNTNGVLFFAADDGETGTELWKFDPGSCTSNIQTNLTITGSTVCAGSSGSIIIKGSQAGVTYQASINGASIGNAVTGGGDITLTIPAVSLSAGNNVYTIQASGCTIATLANTATVTVNNCPPSNCTATGTILREYWGNITGTAVYAIPLNTTPTSTSQITSFETISNQGDNYGQRVRGYVCAPTTGNYTFYIASDDNSELWLSTDDNPVNKKRIAHISGNGLWATPRQWTKFTSQKSAVIALVAGKKYYIEALQKEGVGGDNLAVGWILPNTSNIVVIAGTYLSPFSGTTPANQAPTVSLTSPANNTAFTTPASITIAAIATDNDGSVSKVEFYNGANKLGEDLTSPYSYVWNNVSAGTYTITAKAIDNQNATTTSVVVNVTVNASTGGSTTFYRAINLNGSALNIDNHLYEASNSAANFSFSGRTFANQNISLVPATDANRASMIRSSVYSLSSSPASVIISGVAAGEYEVYVYVWEDNNAETYNLSLEGSIVQGNYNSGGAGKWAKLGPFRKQIADGVLNLVASGGASNLSGIEIWKVNTTPAATPVSIPFRINSGGHMVNADGVTFNADAYFSANSSTTLYQKPIINTTRDIMYVDYREAATDGGSFSYNIPVSNGTYTVNLNFAEVFHNAAGSRVFSVNLERGTVELANFDVYAAAGANTAITKVYTVTVNDGMLNIDFTSSVGKAMINALQVQAAANARMAAEELWPSAGNLSAYPNPFADKLQLSLTGVEAGKVVITLTDVIGKQHYSTVKQVSSAHEPLELDLPELKAGVYLLKLQAANGRSKVLRVVKK